MAKLVWPCGVLSSVDAHAHASVGMVPSFPQQKLKRGQVPQIAGNGHGDSGFMNAESRERIAEFFEMKKGQRVMGIATRRVAIVTCRFSTVAASLPIARSMSRRKPGLPSCGANLVARAAGGGELFGVCDGPSGVWTASGTRLPKGKSAGRLESAVAFR
jgi:hypothetical protein